MSTAWGAVLTGLIGTLFGAAIDNRPAPGGTIDEALRASVYVVCMSSAKDAC